MGEPAGGHYGLGQSLTPGRIGRAVSLLRQELDEAGGPGDPSGFVERCRYARGKCRELYRKGISRGSVMELARVLSDMEFDGVTLEAIREGRREIPECETREIYGVPVTATGGAFIVRLKDGGERRAGEREADKTIYEAAGFGGKRMDERFPQGFPEGQPVEVIRDYHESEGGEGRYRGMTGKVVRGAEGYPTEEEMEPDQVLVDLDGVDAVAPFIRDVEVVPLAGGGGDSPRQA